MTCIVSPCADSSGPANVALDPVIEKLMATWFSLVLERFVKTICLTCHPYKSVFVLNTVVNNALLARWIEDLSGFRDALLESFKKNTFVDTIMF